MDGNKVSAEQTPQGLVAEVRAAVDGATAGNTAAWLAIDNNKRTWLGQLCTALTAALDANEEMHEAIVEWVKADNAKASIAVTKPDMEAIRLRELALFPATGVSLRAELAKAHELIRMLIATEGALFTETKAKATVFLEGAG